MVLQYLKKIKEKLDPCKRCDDDIEFSSSSFDEYKNKKLKQIF